MSYSIDHLRPVFETLGGLNCPAVHLAGSKGKGTTAMLLATALRHCGQRVGLFTSPAVIDETEMIQVDGRALTQSELDEFKMQVLTTAEKLHTELSSFEVLTLAAFCAFNRAHCELAVVECGLGGLTDSTNVLENKILTILTHIELEHTAELGDSLAAIAEQKLGITRPGVPLLTLADQAPEVLKVIEAQGLNPVFAAEVSCGRPHPACVGLAIQALELLGFVCTAAIRREWEALNLPGRFEVLGLPAFPDTLQLVPLAEAATVLVLDGAHTFDSIESFLSRLEEWRRPLGLPEPVFGIHILKDKPADLVELFPRDRCTWIPLPDSRAGTCPPFLPSLELDDFLNAQRRENAHLVVLCGSFRLAHRAHEWLNPAS